MTLGVAGQSGKTVDVCPANVNIAGACTGTAAYYWEEKGIQ